MKREKLSELTAALLKEAQRRGLVVDIDPVTQEARVMKGETSSF